MGVRAQRAEMRTQGEAEMRTQKRGDAKKRTLKTGRR